MARVEWNARWARVSSLTSHGSKRNTDALSFGTVKGAAKGSGPCFSSRELLSRGSTTGSVW